MPSDIVIASPSNLRLAPVRDAGVADAVPRCTAVEELSASSDARYRVRQLGWLLAGSLLALPAPARADPATHGFSLKARTMLERGAGPEAFDCMIYGTLRNRSKSASEPVELAFSFPGHPGLEEGELSTFNFAFPRLAPGEAATVPDHVAGMRCRDIAVRDVSAGCEMRCGFTYIAIARSREPRLRERKIVAQN